MRKHPTLRVRLETDARHDAATPVSITVRAAELVLENPDGGVAPTHEHALLLPGAQRLRRLAGVVRAHEPDSVVRARREQALMHLRRDDVVRRRDEIVQPACPFFVVTEGAKR